MKNKNYKLHTYIYYNYSIEVMKKKILKEYYIIKVDIEQNTHPKHPQSFTSFTKPTNQQHSTLTSKS